ncbi:Isoleucine--tRNA ligase [Phycisphaerae bacterium RAS2]|nr:Isoleucine--tRNA ligase [Phycisphaerae bacterium RAS2]
MFNEVPSQLDFPAMEKRILAYWQADNVYQRSLDARQGCKPFVFFEGPPTANGLPHPGHCLTRAIKDLFPRYKTMTGHLCTRKGGWDTHGLPVEVEVCKELGIHTKEEIEAYGVEAFNRKCLESVFRYTREWEEMTRRLGFWVNLEEAYVTYHQSYVESVWWSLKSLFDAGLLYQGHKIVWWWAQGGTALSSGEVGQGYREVDDPSVFVRFPLVEDQRFHQALAALDNEPRASARAADQAGVNDSLVDSAPRGLKPAARYSLLVWTTTPWTLPSNMFAAVHKDFDYAVVHDSETGERLIFAAALVEQIAKKVKKTDAWKIERTVKGADLLGLSYRPPFDLYRKSAAKKHVAHASATDILGDYKPELAAGGADYACWRVLHADFVTLESGTGLVHEAPAFGEVDFDLMNQERKRFTNPASIPLLCAVAPNGTFTDEGPEYCRGRWVKECDKDICRDLKERGLLLHQEQYRHDYPFCWRADEDPLIQYPRRSWFIRTTQFRDAMLANNEKINWLPEHIKEGRFGNFLRDNVDWSLSRERYWGTPLPIWVCESCGHMEAVDSYESLSAKSGVAGLDVWEKAKAAEPSLSDHLKIHKPYIDAVTFACPKCAHDRQAARAEARGSLGNDASARMKRVPEVIDCWYDSGAMPFAQWGWPHKNHEMFLSQFPADFISEALDQTRGWFYSLTAISVMLFSSAHMKSQMERNIIDAKAKGVPDERLKMMQDMIAQWEKILAEPRGRDVKSVSMAKGLDGSINSVNMTAPYPLPFRNCIVLGLLMGEDGLKMSKSKKNYKEPTYIFDHEGADAMRWLFFSGQTPWTSIRFQESAIAEGQREFLIRLYNCYSFFVIYANIDRWTPNEPRASARAATSTGAPSGEFRSELDRWILSELAQCSVRVFDAMEAYDNFTAARTLSAFVDALSNWYIRRSRDRYWKSAMDADKHSAYATLYECLVTVSKLIAPFTPFIAEEMYQNLVVQGAKDPGAARAEARGPLLPSSVHLCDYPVTDETREAARARIDVALNEEIELVRQLVSCGRAARAASKLRVRQPLATMELFHRRADVVRKYEAVICDELNVKRIEFKDSAAIAEYVTYELKPDFRKIGPKHGSLAPKIKAALAAQKDVDALVRQLEQGGACRISVAGQDVELTSEEMLVELHAKEGFAAERVPGCGILVLDTHLTPALLDEGMARDLVNQIQQVRKNLNLRYEQHIDLAILGDADIQRVLKAHGDTIRGETLADSLRDAPLHDVEPARVEVDGHAVEIYVHHL